MEYRIVEGFDPNAVPGSNLVDNITNGSISYNAQPGMGNTQTLTIAYYDSISDNWLVGAEPSVMATLPGPQYTLDELVDADPGEWRTYRGSESDGSERHFHGMGFGDIPKGILIALGVSAPLPTQYLPFELEGDCVGLKPEPPWSCGPFKAHEASDVWYGDDIGIVLQSAMISVPIDAKDVTR